MFNQSPNKLVHHPEHGLLIPVHAKVRGKFKVSAFDADGRPQLLRTPSGDIIQPLEGVEHSNLITDSGLDAIGTWDIFGKGGSSGFRSYFAIGTGSEPPALSDTALDNEVQRGNSSGSFSSPGDTGVLDGVANVWRATSPIVRVLEMNEPRNLTEFGFSHTTSGASIRELIRNAAGDPVPVSLGEGLFFRCDHTLIVELEAPLNGFSGALNIEEYDAGGNLENTIPVNITWGFRAAVDTGTPIAGSGSGWGVFNVWQPTHTTGVHTGRVVAPLAYQRIGFISSGDVDMNTIQTTLEPYELGSHERVRRRVYSAGDYNAPWHGFYIGNNSFSNSTRGGLLVIFDDGFSYTKLNTTTLRLGLTSTWERA